MVNMCVLLDGIFRLAGRAARRMHYANPEYWMAYRWIPRECVSTVCQYLIYVRRKVLIGVTGTLLTLLSLFLWSYVDS